jgi:alcohol oxidase
VSLAEQPLNICKNFLSVAEKFDKDRGSLDDTNAFFSCDGYGVRKSHHPATFIIY